jgi:hypothetical protein
MPTRQPPDDPTEQLLTPATDPWPDATTVPGAFPDPTALEPQVIFVERRRRRRWPWFVGALASFCVICSLVGWVATGSIRDQYPAHIAIPADGVAGLRVLTGADIDTETNKLERQIRQDQGVDEAFARVLQDPAANDQPVYLFGATKLILDPSGELDKAMRDLANASNIQKFDPGALGGYLRCGSFVGDDAKPAVACAWIDYGSIGVAVCPGGRSMDRCKSLLGDIRAAILVRP